MNKLSLGTAQFGMDYGVANKTGQVSDDELDNILFLASKYDIDSFDTAIAYGDAETRLGDKRLNKNYKIISKIGEIPSGCSNIIDWLSSEIKDSQQRLKIARLEGVLLHRPQQLFSSQGKELYNAILGLKGNGIIDKIGVSIYSPEELEKISEFSMKMDMVQIPFNIIDSRFISSGWIERLYQQGVEIHVRSIFLQGLLLMSQHERPAKFNHWREMWSCWHEWLEQNQITALEACLNYVLSFKEISKIVIGIDYSKQLIEILNSIENYKKIEVPEILKIQDDKLLNPSYWGNL